MPDPVTGLIGGAAVLGGSAISAGAQRGAANQASQVSAQASERGIEELERQFDVVQEVLEDYRAIGTGTEDATGSIEATQALLGLLGDERQAQELEAIQRSPEFTESIRLGEEAILQNAAATGGLRGGDTQAALSQFRPQVLSSLIDQRFNRLMPLNQLAQASAAGVGSAALSTGQGVANLVGQNATNQANAAIARGNATSGLISDVIQTGGFLVGAGAF